MQHLAIINPKDATGELAEVYGRMLSRKMPAAYRPDHGGLPGIMRSHSLDAKLIPIAFGFSNKVNMSGPLAWPLRELVAATTSRINQCFY